MEFRFEIRMPGSIFCTLKGCWDLKKMWSNFKICTHNFPEMWTKDWPMTYDKQSLILSFWRIWKEIWMECVGKDGKDTHLVKVFFFLISVCLWLLAGVKMWLTSDVQYCAHSWFSINHSLNLLQNILYSLFFFFKNNLYIWWSWEAYYWTRATSWLKHIKYVLKC